jgi:RimJ/RimL family protein N-acetyltransferase
MADPGALLSTTHKVDGMTVRLRLTRPADGPAVRTFLEELSPETMRRRFLVPATAIGNAIVRHFTFFDPRQRQVVAAATATTAGEEIVGLADVALLSTGLAELAVVVSDEHQGKGVGTLLTEVIASLAGRQGATHLKAVVLPENRAMMRLLERVGPAVRTFEEGGLTVYAKLPASRRRAA